MNERASGILLHVTSLPSPYGIGDFGLGAYRFIDFLTEAGQRYWQILPLAPTNPVLGNSPYSSPSAFAGNTLLISPELLIQEGWLYAHDLPKAASLTDQVDYGSSIQFKNSILQIAYKRFKTQGGQDFLFDQFCQNNAHWLDDYALFTVIKQQHQDAPWYDWPKDVRDRNAQTLAQSRERGHDKIVEQKFYQYLFFKQWGLLKKYAQIGRVHV